MIQFLSMIVIAVSAMAVMGLVAHAATLVSDYIRRISKERKEEGK